MSEAFKKGDRVRHKTGRGDIGFVVDVIPAEGSMLTTYKVQITKPIGLTEGTVYEFFANHIELVEAASTDPKNNAASFDENTSPHINICQEKKILPLSSKLFLTEVIELAKEYDLPFFIVTDGASVSSNCGSEAVRHAHQAHKDWERSKGIDPEATWSFGDDEKDFIQELLSLVKIRRNIKKEMFKHHPDDDAFQMLNTIQMSLKALINQAYYDLYEK